MKSPPGKNGNSGLLNLVCLAIFVGLFIAGLWPFQFWIANNVHWIGKSPGLQFDTYGIVTGTEPIFGPGGVIDLARPFTIQLEVRPHEEPSTFLPRILSAYDADGRELFFLGQWKSWLILRIFEKEQSFHLAYRETGAGGLRKDVPRSILVRSDNNVLIVFVDGKPAKTRSGVNFAPLSIHGAPAWLILGNSPAGESSWRGDLLTLAFYTIALSPAELESQEAVPTIRYDFSDGSGTVCHGGTDSRYDLVIPSVFRAPKKRILVPPWRVEKFDMSFWKDVSVNILGFIPFGFTAYAWLQMGGKRKSTFITIGVVLLGASISVIIELIQVYLPMRHSSLTDVLNNTLGSYIGAQLCRNIRNIFNSI